MMLRTDLDHLPFAMQQEVRRIAALLFEGFDAMLAGKRTERYKSGHIVKLILYGHHAAQHWAFAPPAAPIRLLAIVNHNKLAARRDDWTAARDRLRRAWELGEISHPVRLCVHGLSHVNHALVHGVPWFVTIATEGIALYEASSARLESPRTLPPARHHERGKAEFTRWHGRATDFLLGAAFYQGRDNMPMAALLLHQACEHLYQCVAWSLTLHGLRTHALDELREVAEELDRELAKAWPRETLFERRVFGCIRRAYVEVRYGRNFRINPEELVWAMERAAALNHLVETRCNAWLDARATAIGETAHG